MLLFLQTNSASVNGLPSVLNPTFLTQILRNMSSFDGFVVTDWSDRPYAATAVGVSGSDGMPTTPRRQDIIKAHEFYRLNPTMESTVQRAVQAGVDMSMVPPQR